MRQLALFLFILFNFSLINGQVVTIGSGNNTNTSIPSVLSQNYSYSQQIYTASELDGAAPICGISLFKTSSGTIYRYVTVYLGNTEQSEFSSNDNWIPAGELTVVFSGIVKFLPNTWSYISFDTPFQYDGVDNLVIAFDDNTQIKEAAQTFKTFSTPNGSIYKSSDISNPDPASPPVGTRVHARNQIKIHKCTPTPMSNSPIHTCDLLYSDPGGMDNYSPNQNFTQVITSSSPNSRLEVRFLDFNLADGDTLWIYNGNSTNAPLVGIFGVYVNPFSFTSSGGSLTFKFKSDNSIESAGWLAQIECRSCTPVATTTGSPCQPDPNSITGYAAKPFCTDENPMGITYPSGISGSTESYITAPGCLGSTPAPAWYFMRINTPGDLLIYISQTSIASGAGIDVDFACWGPFYADNQNDFMQRWCCGEYNLYDESASTHKHPNGVHTNDMGGYPISNLVDCSYHIESTEWAFIPNAQEGQYYILLITNYRRHPGIIYFNTVSEYTTATTDCSVLASITGSGHICEGESIYLNSNNNQPDITHSWSGPNGFTSTYPNPIIPGATSANSGTYYLTVTNQAGNSSTDSTQVFVHPIPSVTLSSSALSICSGESVTLTADGANSYSWSHDLGPGSQHTTIPPNNTNYIVIGNSYGCIDTAQITITVNPSPQVQIQEPMGEMCPNSATISINSISFGGSPGYSYSWSGVGIVNQNSSTTQFTPNITHCDTEIPVTLEVTDQNLCTGRDSISINVSDIINPQFTTLPFPFQYATGTFPNYTMPDLTDLVRNNSSDNCWNINQLNISQSIAAGAILNENCYVQVTVTDPCGNSSTASVRIIIPFYVQMTDSTQVSCFGGNDGSATVSGYGGIPPYQYQWSNSASPGGTVNSSLQAGNYQVTVTDSLGVSLSAYVTITQPNLLSVNYTTTDTYCERNNGKFEVIPAGGTPPYQYSWSNGENSAQVLSLEAGLYSCTITDIHGCTTSLHDTIHKLNPMEITGIIGYRETCNQHNGAIEITFSGGTAPYEYQWNSGSGSSGNNITQLASGYYFVTVTDQYGCTDTTSVEIGGVDFTASVLEVTPSYCEQNDGTVTLSLTGDVENPHIDWGPVLHHNHLYAYQLSGGSYTVYVEDYGCVDTVTFEIEEIPKPVACFEHEPNNELMVNQLIYFFNCSTDGESYEWKLGDGSSYVGYDAQHRYLSTGIYKVTLVTTNQYACVDSSSVNILISGEITVFIPNSFTPNHDGVNDVFIPIFSSVSETGYQLSIFNRWGEIIFQTTNPSDGWDGTHQNKAVPSGTYSYLLYFQNDNGKGFKRTGSINLIR